MSESTKFVLSEHPDAGFNDTYHAANEGGQPRCGVKFTTADPWVVSWVLVDHLLDGRETACARAGCKRVFDERAQARCDAWIQAGRPSVVWLHSHVNI